MGPLSRGYGIYPHLLFCTRDQVIDFYKKNRLTSTSTCKCLSKLYMWWSHCDCWTTGLVWYSPWSLTRIVLYWTHLLFLRWGLGETASSVHLYMYTLLMCTCTCICSSLLVPCVHECMLSGKVIGLFIYRCRNVVIIVHRYFCDLVAWWMARN